MLSVSFPGHPKANVMVMVKPINGVSGLVECEVCGGHWALTFDGVSYYPAEEEEAIAGEIEVFIKTHKCLPLAREEEAIAFSARMKRLLPKSAGITITKNR